MDKEVTNCIRKDIATTVEQLKDAVDQRSKDASPAAVTSMDTHMRVYFTDQLDDGKRAVPVRSSQTRSIPFLTY